MRPTQDDFDDEIRGHMALSVKEGIERGENPEAALAEVLARVAAGFFGHVPLPGALPVMGATGLLVGAAIVASPMPAARASRVDVLQALGSE